MHKPNPALTNPGEDGRTDLRPPDVKVLALGVVDGRSCTESSLPNSTTESSATTEELKEPSGELTVPCEDRASSVGLSEVPTAVQGLGGWELIQGFSHMVAKAELL